MTAILQKRKRGAQVVHGHRKGAESPTYRSWHGMLDRCQNPKATSYPNYGGRGITVCERWADFRNFLSDMGERQIGTTLDRIDNERGYEPGNCRWATHKQQKRNQRHRRYVTHQGVTRTVSEWAEVTGLPFDALKHRLAAGWSAERALTEPMKRRSAR